MLTMWHCPHSPTICCCCCSRSISLDRRSCLQWPDAQMPDSCIDPASHAIWALPVNSKIFKQVILGLWLNIRLQQKCSINSVGLYVLFVTRSLWTKEILFCMVEKQRALLLLVWCWHFWYFYGCRASHTLLHLYLRRWQNHGDLLPNHGRLDEWAARQWGTSGLLYLMHWFTGFMQGENPWKTALAFLGTRKLQNEI